MTHREPTTANDDIQSGSSGVVAAPLRIRYRVRFSKVGLLRWISHRDLARLWERLVRRASLPMSMTEGFNPKPRISFPSALALGTLGVEEVAEMDLSQALTPAELLSVLCADDQPGLTIHSVQRLPEQSGKARLHRSDFAITIPQATDIEAAKRAIENLRSQEVISILRKNKTISVHLELQIPVLRIASLEAPDETSAADTNPTDVRSDCELQLSIMASDAASLNPSDLLKLLQFDSWIPDGATITRTRVQLEREFETNDADLIAFADAVDVTAKALQYESAS